MFRDTKQFAGLEACQCWVDQALVRHVALVLVTLVLVVGSDVLASLVERRARRWTE